ncbi:MAG: cytochrome b N-terminal domain-containing protein [Planctomyces sp.]|nr:cytochrome b N-terminal domain-containing protein [Planctomyces sp.]
MKALLGWLDDRTGYRSLLHEALYERIPGGARWRYVWGSTLTFVFALQVVTGFCLWMGYSPSARTAWESVYYIQHEMTLGWLLRGIHHFAAQAMVVLMVLHLMQVVIDGAYKAPREVNFWLGLVLMQIVLGLGLTGYLLPWDQKGYYATQVATEIIGSTPVIGPDVQQLVQGGPRYGHATLTRFFALHAGILPTLLVGFLALHIYVFRRHGITARQPLKKPETTFWPDQVLMDAVACLAVLAAVMLLAVWKGAELSAPANPAAAYGAARPEWYYLFLFRFLKFGWVSHAGEVTGLGEAFGSVVLPGAVMLVIVLMPLIAKLRGGHRFNIGFLSLVVLGAAGLTGVALYEDWFQDDADSREFRAAVAQAHEEGLRAVELAQSETGIPPEGAITLLRNDPKTQGPRIFKKLCSDCHRWEGHDGTGGEVLAMNPEDPQAPPTPAPAKAPDLATFGSREWLRSVLTDFSNQMAPTANATANAELAHELPQGTMAGWSETNGPLLLEAENAGALEDLIEFVYAQSRRPGALTPDDPKVLHGREIFSTGELTQGQFDSACTDCHSLHAIGDAEALATDMQPVLTGYGGQEWLREMLLNPDEHYGSSNAMPSFRGQMSEHELSMLIRWMTGDYYTPQRRPVPDLASSGSGDASATDSPADGNGAAGDEGPAANGEPGGTSD